MNIEGNNYEDEYKSECGKVKMKANVIMKVNADKWI